VNEGLWPQKRSLSSSFCGCGQGRIEDDAARAEVEHGNQGLRAIIRSLLLIPSTIPLVNRSRT
jgi:hypothetical protein